MFLLQLTFDLILGKRINASPIALNPFQNNFFGPPHKFFLTNIDDET